MLLCAQSFLPLLTLYHSDFARAILRPGQRSKRRTFHWLQKKDNEKEGEEEGEEGGEEGEFSLCSLVPSEVPKAQHWP